MHRLSAPVVAVLAVACCEEASVSSVAQAFTRQQADAGAKSYQTFCAPCHQPDLSGLAAPALVGPVFLRRWGPHTVTQLIDYVRTRMPKDDPGTLPDEEYLDIVAYVLAINGALPRNSSLTITTEAKLSQLLPALPARPTR